MKKNQRFIGLPKLTKVYDGKELKRKSWLRPGAYSLETTPSLHCGTLYYPNGKTKAYDQKLGDCDDIAK